MIELITGIIVACMPSMLLVRKWFRGGDTMADKKTRAQAGPRGGPGGTFGGGTFGGGGRARRHSHNETMASELHTPHRGSEEYIMRDLDSTVKSTEIVEMGVPPGSRGGDGNNVIVC